MFKSKTRRDALPKNPTREEIEEDLRSFCKSSLAINKEQILEDLSISLKENNQEGINSQWWDLFTLNEIQLKDLQETREKLLNLRADISKSKDELEHSQKSLKSEISANLSNLHEMKTPK